MSIEESVTAFLAEHHQDPDAVGFWHTCSGCHESEDGYDVGHYPHSAALRTKLGAGCSECGGIGAYWDTTDYNDMADWMQSSDRFDRLFRAGFEGRVLALTVGGGLAATLPATRTGESI